MGRDKASMQLPDGRTLAEVVLDALRPNADRLVVVGHGRGVPASELLHITDEQPGLGPLGGLQALLQHGEADSFIVVPCDMPLVTAELLARLPAPHPGGVGLFSHASGDTEPFPMRLHPEARTALQAWLAVGRRDVRGFVASLTRVVVALNDDEVAMLANVNRATDLAGAAAEMTRRSGRVRATGRAPVGSESCAVVAVRGGIVTPTRDHVAAEEPLEIQIGAVGVAVVMRTPGFDEDLALGFLLTERVITAASDVASLRHCTETDDPAAIGNVMRATLTEGVQVDVLALRRNMYVGSSCGVCGKASIEEALQTAPPLEAPAQPSSWTAARLAELPGRLREAQRLFGVTGGLHAAGLFSDAGDRLVVREDVGRHNAVDKTIGWAARQGLLPGDDCLLAVSGRVSFEVVQKAVAARIPIIAAVSAPTSLAVSLAAAARVTIVGFLRGDRFNIYGEPGRLAVAQPLGDPVGSEAQAEPSKSP